jgi:hypothetical protein
MELFLLFIPAIVLPIGLSLAGLWWLMSEDNGDEQDFEEDDFMDGGI